MLNIGDKHKVIINNLDYKGDGVTKIDNTYLYIPGVITNEEVTIEITKLKKGYGTAKAIEINKESIERINPISSLGSLNLFHLSFKKQLEWQKQITKETLEKVTKRYINVFDTITDEVKYHYRNKAVFHVLNNNILRLGLFSNNNQELTIVNDFVLANNEVNRILKAINNAQIEIDENIISNFIFKNNRVGEILVTIVSKEVEFKGLDEITDLLKTFSSVVGLTINIKKYIEKILSNESYLVYGNNLLREGILLINDQSFMQVNFGVMDLTYKLIKENILGTKIIDAYSGVGSIGFSINDLIYQITMIENGNANIELANKIKEENNFNNIEIINANAEEVIGDYSAHTIIVDPPRKGLAESLIDEITNNKIPRVIYLSCDLQTLARDLRFFDKAYEVSKVYPIKMFPQTNSFETLVILTRKAK